MHLKELYAQDKEHDAENPWTFEASRDLVRDRLSDLYQALSSRRKKDLTVLAKNIASDRKKTIAGAEEELETHISETAGLVHSAAADPPVHVSPFRFDVTDLQHVNLKRASPEY